MPYNIIELVQQFGGPRIARGIITGPNEHSTILGKDRLESGDGGSNPALVISSQSGAILDFCRNRVGDSGQSTAKDLLGVHSFED